MHFSLIPSGEYATVLRGELQDAMNLNFEHFESSFCMKSESVPLMSFMCFLCFLMLDEKKVISRDGCSVRWSRRPNLHHENVGDFLPSSSPVCAHVCCGLRPLNR